MPLSLQRSLATLACLLAGCGNDLAGGGLGWTVDFACDSDRLSSDQLRLVMHKGDCSGPVVYDQLLSRGQQAPATEALAPGRYGFEAIASAQGTMLAQGCVASELPSGNPPNIVLSSAACAANSAPLDAGAVQVDGAPVLVADADVAGLIDAGSANPPEVDGSAPVCTGSSCGCERSCSGTQICQNGACKPTDSGAASCVPRHYAGHDYLFCTDRQSWYSARRKCRAWGYGLAIIDSQAENDFVHGASGGQDRWLAANDLGANDVAGFDLTVDLENLPVGVESNCVKTPGQLGEGTWYWASAVADVSNDRSFCQVADENPGSCSASASSYQSWRAGEPDNATCNCLAVCSPGQDCALMHGNDGSWGDEACIFFSAYVCESP